MDDIKLVIESLLFAYSEPITAKEIKNIIHPDLDLKYVEDVILKLKNEYKEQNRGIAIICMNDKYVMSTNAMYEQYIKKLFEPKKKKSLTQAALETLTIIAYKQPITKLEIEDIRGVKCDKAVSTLVENALIEEAGRLDKIGKPILYKTTDEFLKVFEIEKIDELPNIESFETNN